MKIGIILLSIHIFLYFCSTFVLWLHYWRHTKKYTLYDVLFNYKDIERYDTDMWETMALFRFIPLMSLFCLPSPFIILYDIIMLMIKGITCISCIFRVDKMLKSFSFNGSGEYKYKTEDITDCPMFNKKIKL